MCEKELIEFKENLIDKIKKFAKKNKKETKKQDKKYYIYIDGNNLKIAKIDKDKYIFHSFGCFNDLEIAEKVIYKFEKEILEINNYGLWTY